MIDTSENQDRHLTAEEAKDGGVELRADVVERDGRPDECTIWPHNASGTELLTRWIAAEEGSYYSLEEMR